MTRTKQLSNCLLLMSVLFSLVGCGIGHTGKYASEVRVKRGLDSSRIESLQPELKKAQEKTKGFVEQLVLKSGGRYWKKNIDREFDGDWWVDDDGRLAVRVTHQDGKSLGALISKGADRHWEIGSDGNLYRYWDNPKSELEFVFVKQ